MRCHTCTEHNSMRCSTVDVRCCCSCIWVNSAERICICSVEEEIFWRRYQVSSTQRISMSVYDEKNKSVFWFILIFWSVRFKCIGFKFNARVFEYLDFFTFIFESQMMLLSYYVLIYVLFLFITKSISRFERDW